MFPHGTILLHTWCSAVDNSSGSGLSPWVWILAPLGNSCVILGYLASLSLCPCLQNGDDNSTRLVGLLWGLQESLLLSSSQSSVGMSIGPSEYLLQVFIFSCYSTPTPSTFSEAAFSSCKVNSASKQCKGSARVQLKQLLFLTEVTIFENLYLIPERSRYLMFIFSQFVFAIFSYSHLKKFIVLFK